MFEVKLGNGVITLSSKAALDKIDEVSLSGDLWSYIAQLVERDATSTSSNEKLDEVLALLRSGKFVGEESKASPTDVSKSDPIAILESLKMPSSGSAANVLGKMRALKGKGKGAP